MREKKLKQRTPTAAAWMRKPIRLKRNSPCDARATPDDIIKTMMASLRLGSWIRVVHEIRRIATGVNAYANVLYQESRGGKKRASP
jgi:hypothetical protein